MANTIATANAHVSMLDIIMGNMMSVELALPALSRRPIMVVGSSCMDTEFITSNIMAEKLALPEPSSSFCMAVMPLGVDALPNPSMFDAMFMAMYLLACGSLDLNKYFIMGESSFSSFCASPLLSTISSTPSHMAYMPSKFMHSSTACSPDASIWLITWLGFVNSNIIVDGNIIKNHTLLMV